MSSEQQTTQAITKSAGTIGGLTLISRVLGFGRDILIASIFGTTVAAEAFVVSFKLPNLFRDLVGEGAMNSAIVPVLSETRAKQGHAAFCRLATALMIWFLGILALICLLGVVFAPLVVRLAAPGFYQNQGLFLHTTQLTRMMFPLIFMVGFAALFMGILNTQHRFASSAAGPIFLNMSMIGALALIIYSRPQLGVEVLVIGVLIGGALQCLLQLNSFRGHSVLAKPSGLLNDEVKKILRLLGPRVLGTAVYQISVLIDTILASFYWIVGAGGQSALYYASRLFYLPLAIFGISFAQASLPALSQLFVREDLAGFREKVTFALRQVVFMTLPAAMGLAVFADIIIEVLFKRDAFTDYSVYVTSSALFFYAWGLVGCSMIKVLVNGFYAMQDTKTPVKTAALSLAVNLVLNLLLMWHLKIGGLALATSIAATLNMILLYALLRRKIGSLDTAAFMRSCMKSAMAALVMVIICALVLRPWIMLAQGNWAVLTRLLVSVAGSAVIYCVICFALRSEEARYIRNLIFKTRVI